MDYIRNLIENEKNLKEIGDGLYSKIYKLEFQGKEYAVKKIAKNKIDYHENLESREYLKKAIKREIDILKTMSNMENSVKFYYNFEDQNFYIRFRIMRFGFISTFKCKRTI